MKTENKNKRRESFPLHQHVGYIIGQRNSVGSIIIIVILLVSSDIPSSIPFNNYSDKSNEYMCTIWACWFFILAKKIDFFKAQKCSRWNERPIDGSFVLVHRNRFPFLSNIRFTITPILWDIHNGFASCGWLPTSRGLHIYLFQTNQFWRHRLNNIGQFNKYSIEANAIFHFIYTNRFYLVISSISFFSVNLRLLINN